MPKYTIPVGWMVTGEYDIMAPSLEDAIRKARDLPLPGNEQYVHGSFEIYEEQAIDMNRDIDDKQDTCFTDKRRD